MRRLVFILAFFFLASCSTRSSLSDWGLPDPDDPLIFIQRDTPVNDLELEQVDIVNKMLADYPGVDAKIVWEPCFQVNAFYFPSDHTIHMCEEIEVLGEGAVMAAAHEAGHAVTHQLTSTTGEQDADEIGALEMLKYHKHQGVVDQVEWFWGMQREHVPGDPHPSSYFRAWELACLELGSRGEVPMCVELYESTKMKWFMRTHVR